MAQVRGFFERSAALGLEGLCSPGACGMVLTSRLGSMISGYKEGFRV